MDKKIKFVIGSLAFVGIIFGAVFVYGLLQDMGYVADNILEFDYSLFEANSDTYTSRERDPAPYFTIYRWDNAEASLSDFLGRPTVLNFWASWCPQCVIEMPYFEEIYHEVGDDVNIVKVNLLDRDRETRTSVENFMAENGLTFPLYFDNGVVARLYAVRFIPVTFFIDPAGYIAAHVQGPVNRDTLRQGIELASRR